MAVLALDAHFGRQIVRADPDDIHARNRGDRLGVLDTSRTLQQYFYDRCSIQRLVELRRGHLLKIEMSQCGNGGSMAEWRKAARGNDILRCFGGFDARSDDSQHAAVQQPADDAILAFGYAREGRKAEIESGGANQRRGIDRHGAVLEIDPDRVVPGASSYAGDLGGSRTTHAECGNRYPSSETLHHSSGCEPWGLVILHSVSSSVRRAASDLFAAPRRSLGLIVGSAGYIRQYKIAITFD